MNNRCFLLLDDTIPASGEYKACARLLQCGETPYESADNPRGQTKVAFTCILYCIPVLYTSPVY